MRRASSTWASCFRRLRMTNRWTATSARAAAVAASPEPVPVIQCQTSRGLKGKLSLHGLRAALFLALSGVKGNRPGVPRLPGPHKLWQRLNSRAHYLAQMRSQASPFGFVLHPRTREKLKITLLTPFSKKRAGWVHSVCINTHDGKSYHLDELSRADIITLGDILCGYVQHSEIKSLGPDGEKCKPHTRGLLRRMTVHGGLRRCIGPDRYDAL
jgi:hypothetical protein